MMTGVYRIINETNGRSYIGASIHIQQRIQEHKSTLRNNKHHCKELQKDYNLGHVISYEVLEEVALTAGGKGFRNQGDLLKAEQHYMEVHMDNYNTHKAPGHEGAEFTFRLEPYNKIGTVEWVHEIRQFIDQVRPPDREEVTQCDAIKQYS